MRNLDIMMGMVAATIIVYTIGFSMGISFGMTKLEESAIWSWRIQDSESNEWNHAVLF